MFKGFINISLLFFSEPMAFFFRVDDNRDEFMQFSSPDYLDMRVVCLGDEGKNFIDHFTVFLLIGVEIDVEDVLKS